MMFFKVIYYFIGLVFVLVELGKLARLKEYVRFFTDYKSWTKMRKRKKESTGWEETPEEFKTPMKLMLIYFFSTFLWMGLGLFTFNWGFIIVYFIMLITATKLSTNKKGVYSSGLVAWTGFWILFNISFYIFLILNTFHLHINFLELF
jgi:uncharacterized ion transporter superfamily protein YfcC